MTKDKSTFSLQPKEPRDAASVLKSDTLSFHTEKRLHTKISLTQITSNPKTTTTGDQKQYKLLNTYYSFK